MKYIIKIKDKYFEWSTVVDAPTTCGMNEAELREHVQLHYGKAGLDTLPERLARVAAKGTSSQSGISLTELLSFNRAGDGGSEITEEQIYTKYANPNDQNPNHLVRRLVGHWRSEEVRWRNHARHALDADMKLRASAYADVYARCREELSEGTRLEATQPPPLTK